MKVVQKDDARSDDILDNDAADEELGKQSDSEDKDHIKLDEVHEENIGIRHPHSVYP